MAVKWREQSVLIVGAGSAGRRHARVLRSLGVNDIWVCDPVESQRRACIDEGPVTRDFPSYGRALSATPTALILCTPSKMHVPMSIEALEAGVHVLCEKPLSNSMERVEELQRTVEESQKVFAVAFCFRFHEGLTKVKALLDAGRIGRLISIRCFMGENIDEVMAPEQRGHYKQIGGAFDLVHEVDIACWLAGQEVTDVNCTYGSCSDLGFTSPDVVELDLRFGDRCIGNVHLDFFTSPRTRVTELRGTEGTLRIEFASWDKCTVAVYDTKSREWSLEEVPTERDFMFRCEDEEFLRAVAEGTSVTCPLSEALKSQRILELAENE